MSIDIFPELETPLIYVVQPYGGMDPAQMEGYITNYTEFYFLLITGIHHVESMNIQSIAMTKLAFHPGTNMAAAMAETVNYVNRSKAFMPPGTLPPIIMRYDASSVPVGFLVFESDTKTVGQIQDEATFKVRPYLASLRGVSAPPSFGGDARTIVARLDPEALRLHRLSPDAVVNALISGNQVYPSGNIVMDGRFPIVPVNSVVTDIKDLEKIPIKLGPSPSIYLGDIGKVADETDVPVGYTLVNGKRSVILPITKRPDASTLSVVKLVRDNMELMRKALSTDIKMTFQFDQSPYVVHAVNDVRNEGIVGAILTGLMILIFLGDWRSVVIVVLTIPLALLFAIVCLWLVGQSINIMTLGGLALAIGILVDEATVAIENIHVWMAKPGVTIPPGRLGRDRRDDRAADAGHAVHPGRFHSGPVHARRGARPVHSTVAGGGFRHGRLLRAGDHVCASHGGLAAQVPSRAEAPASPFADADGIPQGTYSRSSWGRGPAAGADDTGHARRRIQTSGIDGHFTRTRLARACPADAASQGTRSWQRPIWSCDCPVRPLPEKVPAARLRPLVHRAGLCRRQAAHRRGHRFAARQGDLPQGRCRPVSAAPAGPRRHHPGKDGRTDQGRGHGHQRGGGWEGRDFGRPGRHGLEQLPHQLHLHLDGRSA